MRATPQAATGLPRENLLLRMNHAIGSLLPNGVTAVRATHARNRILVTVWLDDGYFARRFDCADRVLCELRLRHWLVRSLQIERIGDDEAFADLVTSRVLAAAYPTH